MCLGAWAWALWCREAGSRSGPPTLPQPHPTPRLLLAWGRAAGEGREGWWVGVVRSIDLTVSSIACHRVFGHLSAPSKGSRSSHPLAHPRTRPRTRTHAAMQPCSRADCVCRVEIPKPRVSGETTGWGTLCSRGVCACGFAWGGVENYQVRVWVGVR